MKNNKAILLLLILLISILSGCAAELNEKDEIDEVLYEKDEKDEIKTDRYDPNTYKYSNDSRFKVVSIEKIEDGIVKGLTIIVLVDKKTKVMYMQSERYINGYSTGYNTTLQVLLDAEGKPLLYDGNLE